MKKDTTIGSNESGQSPTMKDFNMMMSFVVGIALVCVLAFLSMLFTYYNQSAVAYDNLKEQILLQSYKLDTLIQDRNLQYQKQIDDLKAKNPYLIK